MATTTQAPGPSSRPVRELIAELAGTEDALRGCRSRGATAPQRAARRRQREILAALHGRAALR